jgi:hypothetical protein
MGFLGLKLYKVWVQSSELPVEQSQQVQPEKKTAREKQLPERKPKRADRTAYDVIAQNDLFRPSRSASEQKDSPTQVSTKEKPILFGTIIMDNEKSAILEDPTTKVTKLYKINDSLAGYTVEEIQEDKVVLLKDGNPVEVKLRAEKDIKMPVQKRPAVQRRRPTRRTPRSAVQQQQSRTRSRPARRQPPRVRSRSVPAPEETNTDEAEELQAEESLQNEGVLE